MLLIHKKTAEIFEVFLCIKSFSLMRFERDESNYFKDTYKEIDKIMLVGNLRFNHRNINDIANDFELLGFL